MTAPLDEFSVSLSDLSGFAEQVSHLGDMYDEIHDVLSDSFVGVDMSLVINYTDVTAGQLGGALSSFLDDFLNLMLAEGGACERFGNGLHTMAGLLGDTARDYARMDEAAEALLKNVDPESSRADHAEEIADAITTGEPRPDWQARVSPMAYEKFDPTEAAYQSRPMTYQDAMSGVEGTWGQVVAGSAWGTIDSIFQEATGFSVIKDFIKPFSGNWGFLWYMSDVLEAAATTVSEITTLLSNGVQTLTDLDWTGPASRRFREHAQNLERDLILHQRNLRAASDLLGRMGDDLDDAGTKIAPLLTALLDLMLATIYSVLKRDPMTAVMTLAQTLFDIWIQDGKPVRDAIDGITSIVDTCATTTTDLCDQADALP